MFRNKFFAMLAVLVAVMMIATTAGACEEMVDICHHDRGSPEWKVISISESALDAHLNHQWGADIYPVPVNGCPVIPPPPPPPPPPSVCTSHYTGYNVYKLLMYNTAPEHAGFWENNVKIGVCQIWTNGPFPNADAVSRLCECKMPPEFQWITTSYTVLQVWQDCDDNYIYRDIGGGTIQPFGTYVFGQICSQSVCPLRE